MYKHRIRLTDEEMVVIAASLRARLAMRRGATRIVTERLLARLDECSPGNPAWRLGWAAVANRAQALDEQREPEG